MTRECQSPVGGSHWAIALIGLPWSIHGSGPDSFNCWEFGRLLPEIGNPEDMLAMGWKCRPRMTRTAWKKAAG
jgi:hypothetical protein